MTDNDIGIVAPAFPDIGEANLADDGEQRTVRAAMFSHLFAPELLEVDVQLGSQYPFDLSPVWRGLDQLIAALTIICAFTGIQK